MSKLSARSSTSRARRSRVTADPIPLVVVRREGISAWMLASLQADSRFEIFETSVLRPDWVRLANCVTAVLSASLDDPLSAFGYIVTAGIRTPTFLAGKPRYRSRSADLRIAGAAGFLPLPFKRADLDRLARELSSENGSSVIDRNLRLLLDPIARTARFRDQSIRLTQREFALLHCLSANVGQPVALDDLYRQVWGADMSEQSQGILAVYVFQLRQKLSRLGLARSVKTIRRFGYALVHPNGHERP